MYLIYLNKFVCLQKKEEVFHPQIVLIFVLEEMDGRMFAEYWDVFVDQIEGFYRENLGVEELFSFDPPVNVDDRLKVLRDLDMDLYLLLL